MSANFDPNPTPVFSPDLTAATIAAVNRMLEIHRLSPGPELTRFERAFAAHVGTWNDTTLSSRASDRRLPLPSSDAMTESSIDQVGDVLALALTPL